MQPFRILISIIYAKANDLRKHIVVTYATEPTTIVMTALPTTTQNANLQESGSLHITRETISKLQDRK